MVRKGIQNGPHHHRIPYPPNKGDKIRSYHLLKHLAQHYRVHLATFVDDPNDWQYVPHVEALCASSHFAKHEPAAGRARAAWAALLKNRSLSLEYYRDAGMARWVDDPGRARIDRVLVFCSPMAQYAERHRNARRVIDFCDIDSEKWRQYAEQKKWPMSWVYRYEARSCCATSARWRGDYDASLFVSAPEAELFRTPGAGKQRREDRPLQQRRRHRVLLARPAARQSVCGRRTALVFTGAMDYWPNVDAVKWFAADMLPFACARFRTRASISSARARRRQCRRWPTGPASS
jgi:sugar transferase (PEP-CTERM/EpsH1 system associated)